MAETLRTMSERLATIEAEANADSHTDNSTADSGTASDNESQPEEEAQERPDWYAALDSVPRDLIYCCVESRLKK